ncbi:hypothetical protein ACFT7S_29725 [Streptomyces sp. NPDC057136]|uniref:hypothetical protein n=1 Tax=Streptomyces sp. NPDC057136 TaxID=3346029 RepID=UPI003625A6B0
MTTPGPSGQQTDLRKVFYQCRLGRDDLERMFSMACEGIPLPEVRISTVAANTRFWKTNLPDLVETVRSGAPELNQDWNNLSLEADTASQERGVKIIIDKDRTEVNVSGSDTTWAFGQIARIENFLVSRGAVFSSPRYENIVAYIFLAFFLGAGTFFLVRGVDDDSAAECMKRVREASSGRGAFDLALIALYTVGALIPSYQLMKRRASRAQLKVEENVASGSWWSRLSAGERIAAIGIPVAVIAALAAAVTAANDVWGK